MLKALLAAGTVALLLNSSPASAVGKALSLDRNVEFSSSIAGVQKADFVQGHEAVPLNLQQPRRIRSALEYAESARYDGFNTLLTLLTLLSAAGVFAAASLATAGNDDERIARDSRREHDRQADQGWKGAVMRALEAELLTVDHVEIRRAA